MQGFLIEIPDEIGEPLITLKMKAIWLVVFV